MMSTGSEDDLNIASNTVGGGFQTVQGLHDFENGFSLARALEQIVEGTMRDLQPQDSRTTRPRHQR